MVEGCLILLMVETEEAVEVDEIDEVVEVDEVDEADEADETDETDGVDEADETDEIAEVCEAVEAAEVAEVVESDESDESDEVAAVEASFLAFLKAAPRSFKVKEFLPEMAFGETFFGSTTRPVSGAINSSFGAFLENSNLGVLGALVSPRPESERSFLYFSLCSILARISASTSARGLE